MRHVQPMTKTAMNRLRQIILILPIVLVLFTAPAWAADRGALFKVTAGDHTMYLFGTMHVGLPEFYPLEERIEQAIAAAPVLALEVDPGQPPEAIAAAFRAHALSSPDGQSPAALPPALQHRLDKVLKERNMTPAAVAPFKPWMIATVLALYEYAAQGYRADLSVDAYLAKRARAGTTQVVKLESMESQLALLDSLDQKAQLRLLEDSLTQIESGKERKEAGQIVQAWSHADRAALDKVAARIDSDTTFSGRFMREVLLDGRNGALADKLADLLKRENNAVAAVGVLHLLGKRSVPVLLRARGITVERVY